MPKIIRENGESSTEVSTFCPECCGPIADKVVNRSSVFDENGWYFAVNLTCGNKKCGRKWTEKIVAVSGGLRG